MLQAVLIDDEQISLNALAEKIRLHCPDLVVIGKYTRPEAALLDLDELKPDVLFLDIEMPRINGFHLLEQLRPVSFEVIFTTAYSDYAVDAIRLPALDFLVKPIDQKDLVAAVERLKAKKTRSAYGSGLEGQLQLLLQRTLSPATFGKVALPVLNGLDLVAVDDIVKVRAENVYSVLYFINGKTCTVSLTLKEVDALLHPYDFFRVHKSHIVHLKYILRYIKGEGGTVILTDGSEVEVSRRNKNDFLRRLQGLGRSY